MYIVIQSDEHNSTGYIVAESVEDEDLPNLIHSSAMANYV